MSRRPGNGTVIIFGMDCRVFEDVAEAKLMLPYTGGKPRSRHAVLALNLQSGGGFEIWQYKGREPLKIKEEIMIGDLGIIACKMKVKNIQEDTGRTYQKSRSCCSCIRHHQIHPGR